MLVQKLIGVSVISMFFLYRLKIEMVGYATSITEVLFFFDQLPLR